MSKYYAVIGLLILLVYRLTASPTISWVDSGVIATAAYTLGIANPPGFPLYMVIGHLFTKLPWGSVVERLQLLSQLSAVGIVGIVYLMVAKHASRLSALFAAIALAFSYNLWQQANNVETYTLTNFVLLVLLGGLLRVGKNSSAYLMLGLGLLGGLSLGLNPMIVSLVPAIVWWGVKNFSLVRSRLPVFIVSGALFVGAMILIYSYLPIRAAAHPFLNWGDPRNWERIRTHLFGAGLNIYEPETNSINGFTWQPKIFLESFLHYWHLAIFQFTPLLFPLVIWGAWLMYRTEKDWFWPLALVMLTNLIWVVVYYGGNQESWMITSWMVMAVWLGVGIDKIYKRYKNYNRYIMAAAVLPLLFWYPLLNHSKHAFAEDYAVNLYREVPQGSVIVGGGDFFHSLTAYVREVKGERRDVTPITGNMFYIFDWYRENLRRNSDLVISDKVEGMIRFKSVDEFTQAVDQMIADNPQKQFFVTPLLLRESVVAGTNQGNYHTQNYDLIPHGLLLQVVPKGVGVKPDEKLFNFPVLDKPPFYLERNYTNAFRLLRSDYAWGYGLLGIYYAQGNSVDLAKKYLEQSLVADPDNPALQQNYQTFLGQTASPSTSLRATGSEWKKYRLDSGWEFDYPPDWEVKKAEGGVTMTDPQQEFKITLTERKRSSGVSIEDYLNRQASRSGQLLEQGLAKVPNVDVAYVKVWLEEEKTRLQFFLFLADRVTELVVGPADSPLMKTFDQIVTSLKPR